MRSIPFQNTIASSKMASRVLMTQHFGLENIFSIGSSLVKLRINNSTDRAEEPRNSRSRAFPLAQVLSRLVRGLAMVGKRLTTTYRGRKIQYSPVIVFSTKKLAAMKRIRAKIVSFMALANLLFIAACSFFFFRMDIRPVYYTQILKGL